MMVFLFSDIENSTWLWEHHTDDMWKVIARHDEIIKKHAGRYGGEIVKHTGDGVFMVFHDDGKPLDWAVAVQRQFDREAWGSIGELRIRIGMHAGDGEKRSGDYFGPDVNRAAKLVTVAKAGQILVTPDVLTLHRLPEGTVAKDLGVRMLKGIGELQRIYRLVRADLVHHGTEQDAERETDTSEEPPSLESYQCATCLTINLPNTLFCERCGDELRAASQDRRPAVRESRVALKLVPDGPTFPLPAEREVIVGRGSARRPDEHFLDLSAGGTASAGVSRQHAALAQHGSQIVIEDLGSTNGTYVNRRRITPHTSVPINVGDVIHLGKLEATLIEMSSPKE